MHLPAAITHKPRQNRVKDVLTICSWLHTAHSPPGALCSRASSTAKGTFDSPSLSLWVPISAIAHKASSRSARCTTVPSRVERERNEAGDDDDDDEEAAREEMLESTTAFLRAARAALLRFATSTDGEAPTTDAAWREEVPCRWGDLVG